MLLLAFVTVVHVGVHGSCYTDEQEDADGEGETRCPYSVSFADLLVKKSVLLECFWFWLFLRSVGRWATQPDGLHARHGGLVEMSDRSRVDVDIRARDRTRYAVALAGLFPSSAKC